MKKAIGFLLVLAAALGVACTNKQGDSEAPVFITVDIHDQPGFVDVSVVAPVQVKTINLTSHLKSATATDPNHFADVELQSYTVTYRRTDGGTRVPPVQSFGVGGLLPSGGTSTLNNFPILAATAVQGSPFDQLLPFNGGIDRETGKNEIQTAFDLTFFGHTAAGQRVQSETASGILIFRFGGGAVLGVRPGK